MFEFTDTTISIANMWSSDAYYYDPQEFDDDASQNNQVELPTEYNPVWMMPDPWFTASQCKGDFILVAEFSELEGPKPLITIPKHVPGKFDLNDFSVRIMTVDCQSHPSESFKIHEDTSILMSEVKHGVYGYIHHFTLYDSKARGFVRPFCMAYVTADNSKLDKFYDDIHKEFNSVCWKMRQGNLMVFVKDMTYHLTDLQYTKEKFLERQHQLDQETKVKYESTGLPNFLGMLKPEEEILLQSLTLDSLNSAIKEVKHILQTVNTLIASLDLTAEESEEFGVLISTPSTTNTLSAQNMSSSAYVVPKSRLSTFLNSSVQYSSSLKEQAFPSDNNYDFTSSVRRSGSFTNISSPSDTLEDDYCIYEPKLVRTTNKRRYDKTLRTLHELCLASAKAGLNRLRYVQKYFAKDVATLTLEKREGEVLLPNEGLLTVGRSVHMNFLPQGTDSTVKSSQSANFSETFSDDTGSFQSAESFLSCDDTSPTKPNGIVLSSSLDDLNWDRQNSEDPALLNTTLTSLSESINSVDSSFHQEYDIITESSINSGSFSDLDSSTNVINGSSVKMNDMAGIASSSELDASNCDCNEPFRVFSLPDQIYSLGKTSSDTAGFGLHKLMQKYTFAPHMMFSLLCGRPVVVMGSKKKEVEIKAMLTSLSFLVPGYRRQCCQSAIHTEALTMEDLNQKLIGLMFTNNITKDKLIAKEIERRCTVVDIDRKLMYGPCYMGGILTDIYSKRKNHNVDSTFLLQVYSIIQEISLKAYVFYHTFIVNVSSKLPIMYTDPAEAKLAYEKAEHHFLSNMRMTLHDCEIVKSLAEVVQFQIEGVTLLNCSDSIDAPSSEKADIKLKHVPLQLFKL